MESSLAVACAGVVVNLLGSGTGSCTGHNGIWYSVVELDLCEIPLSDGKRWDLFCKLRVEAPERFSLTRRRFASVNDMPGTLGHHLRLSSLPLQAPQLH